jgi:hypothetical protein
MIALGIVFLLLSGVLGVVSTGAVDDAVAEATETRPMDDICANSDCTEAEDDWASSSTDRDFYGWNITNVGEVIAGTSAPNYTKVGPVTYTITSDRSIVNHDSNAGTITYHEDTSYACSVDTVVACDVEINQLNIAFMAQVIGATGLAVNGIMELTKVGFAANNMNQDMNTTQAGTATAATIQTTTGLVGGVGFATGSYAAWATSETGLGITGLNAMDNSTVPAANFLDGIDAALDSTMHPADPNFNISLHTPLGPVAFVGLGAPETLISTVAADPSNSTVMQRASTYGYMAFMSVDHDGNASTDDIIVPDIPQTFVRDWSLFAGVGTMMMSNGGGSDFNATNSEDINTRLGNLLGVDFTGVDGVSLMVGGHGSDMPTGLVAVSASGQGFGLAAFSAMDTATAMTAYGLTGEQYGAVAMWAGGWATSATSLELGLVGGIGSMNAQQFVNQTFGDMNPTDGSYLANSLNMGGAWGTLFAAGSDPVALNQSQSAEVLYGPLGIATRTGATLFMYGELSGMTPPIDFATMTAGPAMEWNTSTVAALYSIDLNAAAALRTFVSSPIFEDFVPGFLISSFGTSTYLTQEFNNWLLGWHDPVVAALATGNPMDMTVGWTSLESNATYYGSGGIVSDTGTNYTICTGENSSCDKGELIDVDGDSNYAWKDAYKMQETYGLIVAESRAGTTGGFIVGDDGDMVDLSGYGMAPILCTDTGTLKGIPVDECTATLDPLTRPIQAKLLDTDTLLDALPGALPVYFGSDVEMKAEKISGAIIAGSSESTFFLDIRPLSEQSTAPTLSDLQPVFSIESSSEIGDSDAESLASKVVDNKKFLTYWTNFDVPTDFLAPLLYIGAIVCLIGAARKASDESE